MIVRGRTADENIPLSRRPAVGGATAPPPPWHPLNFFDWEVLYYADNTPGDYDADTKTVLYDVSGHDRHTVVDDDDEERPTWRASGLGPGDLPYFEFDGTNFTVVTVGNWLDGGPAIEPPYSIVCVVALDEVQDDNCISDSWGTGTARPLWIHDDVVEAYWNDGAENDQVNTYEAMQYIAAVNVSDEVSLLMSTGYDWNSTDESVAGNASNHVTSLIVGAGRNREVPLIGKMYLYGIIAGNFFESEEYPAFENGVLELLGKGSV